MAGQLAGKGKKEMSDRGDDPEKKGGQKMKLGEWTYEISEVLDWRLHDANLRSALADDAAHHINIPTEYRDTWTAELTIVGDKIKVEIFSGEV